MKTVANTLTSILDTPAMQKIQDRSADIMPLAHETLEHWDLDLYTRKPGPALKDGDFVGTDLDLSTFVFALVKRNAVLNIPSYKGMRAASTRENEYVISKENRHGSIQGLFCNKNVFSFGIRLKDYNVKQVDPNTGRETIGVPRNFTLVGVDGSWHDGWRCIEFTPSRDENDFLNNRELWSGNSVVFKNFVHPNRWISFYGSYYFTAKALLTRMEDEAQHLHSEMKRLLENGVKYPVTGEGAKKEWPKTETTGEQKSITVPAFQAEVDLPEPVNDYRSYTYTTDELVAATARRRELINNISPRLRFAVRSVELAFYKHGFKMAVAPGEVRRNFTVNMPPWIEDATWENDYVLPGKRNKWQRLVLFQERPGQLGISLRYRVWEKKESVAA